MHHIVHNTQLNHTIALYPKLCVFKSQDAGSEGKGRVRQNYEYLKWSKNKWTGLEFSKPQRAAENREKGRKPVAKSSVVPQRPSRLRD